MPLPCTFKFLYMILLILISFNLSFMPVYILVQCFINDLKCELCCEGRQRTSAHCGSHIEKSKMVGSRNLILSNFVDKTHRLMSKSSFYRCFVSRIPNMNSVLTLRVLFFQFRRRKHVLC